MKYKLLLVLAVLSVFLYCKKTAEFNFQGKWQSLNDPHSIIEFTPDQKIILYRDSSSFWAQAARHGELTLKLNQESAHWYNFDAMDGDDIFFKGRIETVAGGRIRIYFLKHHHILDLADEYSRTNDFHSFSAILNSIMPANQKPEDYWND